MGKILSSLEDTINKQAKSLMREKWEELEEDLQLLQEQYLEKVEDLLDNFKSSL